MPWKSNNVTEAGLKKPVQNEGLHSIALEPHYSVPQVAAMWHVSEKTVRRLFDGKSTADLASPSGSLRSASAT
jgi:hypothetical protein